MNPKMKSVLCLYLCPMPTVQLLFALGTMIVGPACMCGSIDHVFIMLSENEEHTHALTDDR